ncbi:hypothetical protein [Arthrobacter sp. ISL-72]|uniref:hypothetical protein n=1 Tax=Arthrobacter sp. ISL-72 TaxID=2819114 RepID=UPI001BE6FAD7|nr:hypothetical protein [Arthrobacter sp. ISL-72]MBT2597474.1 hypothetical protein [Arthrobacter sp. ISL-72]
MEHTQEWNSDPEAWDAAVFEVAEPGQSVGGVGFEGEFQELVALLPRPSHQLTKAIAVRMAAECLVLLCV